LEWVIRSLKSICLKLLRWIPKIVFSRTSSPMKTQSYSMHQSVCMLLSLGAVQHQVALLSKLLEQASLTLTNLESDSHTEIWIKKSLANTMQKIRVYFAELLNLRSMKDSNTLLLSSLAPALFLWQWTAFTILSVKQPLRFTAMKSRWRLSIQNVAVFKEAQPLLYL
jgi:hypothetical protein